MNEKLIYKQICLVMADIDAIGKNQKNQAQNFKFRGIDDVYNSLHNIFARHQIFTVPTVISEEFKEEIAKAYKDGREIEKKCIRAIIRMKYTLYAADGSFIEGSVVGEAIDYGDKAANKAMAIAHKYFLTQTFIIPTEDKDPDSESYELGTKPATITPIDPDTKQGILDHLGAAETLDELKDVFAKAWTIAKQHKDEQFLKEIELIKEFNKERLSNDK